MIRMLNINKSYKKKQVLFDFSLDIETQGEEIIGLLGPNGAGKTTIIKIITGLLGYTNGDIQIGGREDYVEWCKNNVALIPAGERGLRYKSTVYDNIMYFSAMKGVEEAKIEALIFEFADFLNFEDYLNRRVETLSMGEKKKAMILCGLCMDMKVIILDEPSNGLDIDAQANLKDIIKTLSKKLNKTFLISSHDIGFLDGIVNHYVFVFKGRKAGEVKAEMEALEILKIYQEIKGNFGGCDETIS